MSAILEVKLDRNALMIHHMFSYCCYIQLLYLLVLASCPESSGTVLDLVSVPQQDCTLSIVCLRGSYDVHNCLQCMICKDVTNLADPPILVGINGTH